MHKSGLFSAALFTLMIVGCGAPPPAPPVPVGAPADFPAKAFRFPAGETPLYRVDGTRSLVQVFAYRGGALARLGHDHIIASRDATGYFLRHAAGAEYAFSGDLYAPLAAMTVDEEALRDAAGLTTAPSASDREGTRGNMLKSLNAADIPFVRARVEMPAASRAEFAEGTVAELTLTMHGETRTLSVPVTVRLSEDHVTGSGSFELLQSDFGVTPFSILGGALAVQDRIEIRFELYAARLSQEADATLGRKL